MSEFVLLFVILVEGFVTISAEILTIRQLIPVVGNSVVVTSLIIGVFLLFLAYGYRKGGQYQKDFVGILKTNFTKSAVWLGAGLSFALIDLFFNVIHHYLRVGVLVALLIYLLLVTAPLVYFLGQTVPITMNLIKNVKSTGAIGGKILHLSTLGSFLGAVLTSLFLMNTFGVAWTVVVNYLLLASLVLITFKSFKKDGLKIFILCCASLVVYQLNVSAENKLFIKTNSFANYKVIKDGESKILQLNNSFSSRLTADKKGLAYIEYIKSILFEDLALTGKEILVLGAGGFTLSAEQEKGNHFTYVDIDPDIKEVVEDHFLRPISGEFVAADARTFLNETSKKFDVIISDVYSNKTSIPTHLVTKEYWTQIRNALQPGGVAILNIIARPTLEDDYSRRMDNTIRSEFRRCMVAPFKYSDEVSNIIYLCKEIQEAGENKKELYSDGLNQSALDYFKAFKE